MAGENLTEKSSNSKNALSLQILDFCKHVAGSNGIVAICHSDYDSLQKSSLKSTIQVIEVLHNFQPRLMSYVKIIEGRNIFFFVVDQWVFERDIDRGFLGEALANELLFPYLPLFNSEYLKRQEINLKRRLILELLENIVLSYPEYSYTLRIKPEYFMYEVMLSRVRVFPPMAYRASPFLRGETKKEKNTMILQGYHDALDELAQTGVISYYKKDVMISETFVQSSKKPRVRLTNTIKNAPRTLFSSFFGVFPQFLNFLSQNTEAFSHFQMLPWRSEFGVGKNFIDPQKFISVPTAQGYVSLAENIDIQGYAQKVLRVDYEKIEINKFGGVINDVYLIKATSDNSEKRVLVKRFKDLSSFKWFPLSMWSVGARSFSLLGKSRLERECAINELLSREGFNVPKVLYVSANERLVFLEYLEGKNLTTIVKKIGKSSNTSLMTKELGLFRQVGAIYAKVHALNVVLGDAKPDNIIIGKNNSLYLLDFEQAGHNGDKSWDVAEFLYFCGHYLPLNSEQKAEAIAQAFICGYLSAGGNVKTINLAGTPKYTRVFSIFTLPSILLVMLNVCKNVQSL